MYVYSCYKFTFEPYLDAATPVTQFVISRYSHETSSHTDGCYDRVYIDIWLTNTTNRCSWYNVHTDGNSNLSYTVMRYPY